MEEYISQNEIKNIENLDFFANQVVEGFITGLHRVHIMGFLLSLLNTVYIILEKVLAILIGNYSH